MTDAIKNNARAIASRYSRKIEFIGKNIVLDGHLEIETRGWRISLNHIGWLNWDDATRFATTLECARCIVGVMNLK